MRPRALAAALTTLTHKFIPQLDLRSLFCLLTWVSCHRRLVLNNFTEYHQFVLLCVSRNSAMATQGHKHSASLNQKAQLANAYNELGKELSSQKIRVVGNYTLGRVIGEGEHFCTVFRQPGCLNIACRLLRDSPNGHPSSYINSCRYQTDPQGHVCTADA
jgi:hypothetical protein